MPQFGDELIIESYKIPWLIWIQLLVMVLLIILLFFGFSFFTSDDSTSSPASSSGASTSTGHAAATTTHLNNPSSSHRKSKVEDLRARRDAGTSGSTVREEDQSREESAFKGSSFLRIFQHPNHPCNYLGLAKQALFKCFGFDSNSDNPRNRQHDKQE